MGIAPNSYYTLSVSCYVLMPKTKNYVKGVPNLLFMKKSSVISFAHLSKFCKIEKKNSNRKRGIQPARSLDPILRCPWKLVGVGVGVEFQSTGPLPLDSVFGLIIIIMIWPESHQWQILHRNWLWIFRYFKIICIDIVHYSNLILLLFVIIVCRTPEFVYISSKIGTF